MAARAQPAIKAGTSGGHDDDKNKTPVAPSTCRQDDDDGSNSTLDAPPKKRAKSVTALATSGTNEQLWCVLERLPPGIFCQIAVFSWVQDLLNLAVASKTLNKAVQKLNWKCHVHPDTKLFANSDSGGTAGNCPVCQKPLCGTCQTTTRPGCGQCNRQAPPGCQLCVQDSGYEAIFFVCVVCHDTFCVDGPCGGDEVAVTCRNTDCHKRIVCDTCVEALPSNLYCQHEGGCNKEYCPTCSQTHLVVHRGGYYCHGASGDETSTLCQDHVPTLHCSSCNKELCDQCQRGHQCTRCQQWDWNKAAGCKCPKRSRRGLPDRSAWEVLQPIVCVSCWRRQNGYPPSDDDDDE